jgi:hypothetical protein
MKEYPLCTDITHFTGHHFAAVQIAPLSCYQQIDIIRSTERLEGLNNDFNACGLADVARIQDKKSVARDIHLLSEHIRLRVIRDNGSSIFPIWYDMQF